VSRALVAALALIGAAMVTTALFSPRLAAPRPAIAAEAPRPARPLVELAATRPIDPSPTPLAATATPSPPPEPTSTATPSATATTTATPSATTTRTTTSTTTRVPAAAVPILMYHYVRNNPDPKDRIGYGLSVTPELFQAHMEYLADRGYAVVPLRDLTQTQKSLALTFDDGYRDFYTAAWPAMKPHGFRATIFQIVDLIDNHRYLTADQLRELAAAGNEIGSHTLTHSDLTTLSPERLRRELVESRDRLARLVGQPILSFCYPAGRQNAAVRKAVEAAGYGTAVTVQPGLHKASDDRFGIPRVRVYGGMGLSQLARAIGEPPPDPVRWANFLRDRASP
jgi:peptidoglycan/xylan/chitin deacetylase (PgdA/CDA1 family)